MICRLMLLLSGVLLSMSGLVLADTKAGDEEQMQGTWVVVQLVDDGVALPNDLAAKWHVEVTGARMIIVEPDGSHEIEFQLAPLTTPRGIDATPLDSQRKGEKLEGIYEIQGDMLKICLPNEAGIQRPSKFVSESGSQLGVLVLKRATSPE